MAGLSSVITGVEQRLLELFDPERLGTLLGDLVVKLVTVAAVLLVFYILWKIISRLALPRIQATLDKTNYAFIQTVAKFAVMGIGVIAALSAVGVQTGAVLASLGVVGLTIGFALRDTLSNIISGFLIFLDRPFTIDDLIEIDGRYGRVERISLRTTRVITPDGKMLAVPNAEVMNKTVVSYTNFAHLRLDVAVTVGVTTPLDKAREVLLKIVADDPDYLDTPPPRMVVTQLNDYNVGLELQAWLKDERQHTTKRYELRERIFNAFNAAGIEMPFETIQTIHLNAPPGTASAA